MRSPIHKCNLQLRVGHVIEHNGKLLQIVSLQNRAMGVSVARKRNTNIVARETHPSLSQCWPHTCLQRQLGNVNFELRDVITKQKHPAKFRPSDMVESVRLEARKFQCLYTEGERLETGCMRTISLPMTSSAHCVLCRLLRALHGAPDV